MDGLGGALESELDRMASKLSQFLAELKRRKVTRVAVAYALVGIGVIEGAQLIFEALELPHIAWQVLTILILLGFPVALVLAWAVDLTPDGIQRTSALEQDAGGTGPGRGTALARWALAGVTVPVVGVGLFLVFSRRSADFRVEGRVPLAVLPFANLSGGEEEEALTNGIHDDILTQLSKVHALRVTSRTSVMEYRDTEVNLRRIGEELGVDAILEGGVQKAGDRIRINAQLIDARTDEHLWGETYDRPYSVANVFAIQSDLAREITSALHAALLPEEEERIGALPTRDTVAYGLLQRGRELEEGSAVELETAIELFRQAIRVDSLFATAYAELGFAFYRKVAYHGAPLEWADSVLLMARRALALDPDLPLGHNVLGISHSVLGRPEAAKEAYLQAVRLNPSYAGPLNNLGFDALNLGRCDEAYTWLTRAHEVSPRDPWAMLNLADAAMCMDMDEDAVRWLETVEEVDPSFFALPGYWVGLELKESRWDDARRRATAWVQDEPDDLFARELSAVTAMFSGEVEAASTEFESLYRDVPEWGLGFITADIRTGLAWALLERGEKDRARELLAETRQWLEDAPGGIDAKIGTPYGLAVVSALSGNREEALAWLQDGVESGGSGGYKEIAMDPRLKNIADDPRFKALMDRMKADVDSMRARVERGEVDLGIR
ncbi:MAG: tetratricopeptide repeat protein [Gemmatimonadota bacterium]|jgi:TolB-like protein